MELLARGVEGYLRDEAIVARPLEVCYVRTGFAELVKLLRRERLVGLDDVGRHDLAPHLVGHRGHHAVLDLAAALEHLFHLDGVDVLARGDDHVVLAAHDGDKVLVVPCGQVARVEEVLVVFLLGLHVVAGVVVGRLGGRAYDHFAHLFAVLCSEVVWLGAVVVVDFHDPHIVVDTRGACRTGILGQVEGTQERVPKCLRRAVAVVDVGREYLLIADAGGSLQGRAHGHYAVQGAEVEVLPLLFVGQFLEHGGHTDDEGDLVALDVFERGDGVKLGHDHQRGAGVECGAGTGAVEPAAVKPRRRVHRHVPVAHGEVNHHVVAGEYLVDARERHGLRASRCARGVEASSLVVDIIRRVVFRFADGSTFHIVVIGNDLIIALAVDDYQAARAPARELHGLEYLVLVRGVEEEDDGARLADDIRQFAYAQTVADGAVDRVGLVRGDVGEHECGAVEQLEHYDIALPESVLPHAVDKAVYLAVELTVGPCLVLQGPYHGRATAVAPHIAHESFDPCVSAFEYFLKTLHVSVVFVLLKGGSGSHSMARTGRGLHRSSLVRMERWLCAEAYQSCPDGDPNSSAQGDGNVPAVSCAALIVLHGVKPRG